MEITLIGVRCLRWPNSGNPLLNSHGFIISESITSGLMNLLPAYLALCTSIQPGTQQLLLRVFTFFGSGCNSFILFISNLFIRDLLRRVTGSYFKCTHCSTYGLIRNLHWVISNIIYYISAGLHYSPFHRVLFYVL